MLRSRPRRHGYYEFDLDALYLFTAPDILFTIPPFVKKCFYSVLYGVFVYYSIKFFLGGSFEADQTIVIRALFAGLAVNTVLFRKGDHLVSLILFPSLAGLGALLSYSTLSNSMPGFHTYWVVATTASYQVSCALGTDNLSEIFILLTVLIFPFCFFAGLRLHRRTEFFLYLLAMEALLLVTFMVLDLVYFYVFFESLLLPMFVLIGVWGARERKLKAAYYFFLYTLFGSLFLLFTIIYLNVNLGATTFRFVSATVLPQEVQNYLWCATFIAFAVKMPLFPVHIWLPEAHVEAPTVGSMLLASLLLKLGGYGFLRVSVAALPDSSAHFFSAVAVSATLGIIYGSLATIRQIDLKRGIAYSSVAHMNLVVLGIFSGSQEGVDGAIYLMVAHGLVSTALFFGVGVIYDRHHSRLLRYYGGLTTVMPLLAGFFLFFSLANMGFPVTANFVGELLLFAGLVGKNTLVLVLAATGVVWSAGYSLWLFNRVFFGALKTIYISRFTEMTRGELFILAPLFFLTLLAGLTCNSVLDYCVVPDHWDHVINTAHSFSEARKGHAVSNIFNLEYEVPGITQFWFGFGALCAFAARILNILCVF